MSQPEKLVADQFPHLRDQVVSLYARDDIFQELCEDYQACVGAISRLEAPDVGNEALHSEYAALRLRLETELLRFLEEHSDPAA
jgi:hypothetical protein